MQEYFLRKQLQSISTITEYITISDKKFVDERPDDTFKINMGTINNSTFASIGFKKSQFTNCKINHSVFINCYFNRTKFNFIDFTGCKFINCKFENPVFTSCDLKYVVFEGCYVKFEEIIETLPEEYNIRWKLCTNLAMQCLSAGNSEDYRKYFFEEKRASEGHYLNNMFKKREEFYKKKYGTWDSLIGICKYITSRLSYYIWGYGEKIANLLLSMIVIILFFSCVIYANLLGQKSIFICFYISTSQFFNIKGNNTLSFIQTNNLEGLALLEGVMGIIFIGFLVSALFRSINRR